MYYLNAKPVSLLFRLKPAIKSSVGRHEYQKHGHPVTIFRAVNLQEYRKYAY